MGLLSYLLSTIFLMSLNFIEGFTLNFAEQSPVKSVSKYVLYRGLLYQVTCDLVEITCEWFVQVSFLPLYPVTILFKLFSSICAM